MRITSQAIGVDSVLTIVHRLMLHENIGLPHRKHLYQLMANELKIPHVVVSLIYMVMIDRFNVPGSDPMSSKYPESLIKGNPVTPSFARFYFDSKFALNLSENRILDMLETMRTTMPQFSLNYWMHQIMAHLRTRLEPLMLEAVKRSYFTHNDETRILVRSRENEKAPFKCKVEYIQAALSLEQKLVVEMHNNAIERMFRHIAIGRRNWLHTGSHFVAENIAFMYSLLKSCKLNNIDLGGYVEDILTRIMQGEIADSSFLPNNYTPRQKKELNVA